MSKTTLLTAMMDLAQPKGADFVFRLTPAHEPSLGIQALCNNKDIYLGGDIYTVCGPKSLR